MTETALRTRYPTRWLTITAMLMALNIAMSSFGTLSLADTFI